MTASNVILNNKPVVVDSNLTITSKEPAKVTVVDGKVVIELPSGEKIQLEGQVAPTRADGTVEIKLPNGSVISVKADKNAGEGLEIELESGEVINSLEGLTSAFSSGEIIDALQQTVQKAPVPSQSAGQVTLEGPIAIRPNVGRDGQTRSVQSDGNLETSVTNDQPAVSVIARSQSSAPQNK